MCDSNKLKCHHFIYLFISIKMSLFTIRTLIDYMYSDATYDWVESELSFRAGRCPHTQEELWSYESTNPWLKEGVD